MRAAIYENTGPAGKVLRIVDLPTPSPAPGEVQVKIAWSGVNPSDVKTRAGLRSRQLPFPRIIPHSDGAGTIEAIGKGVSTERLGQRVWIWNAAWGRPTGTAAEYVVLPTEQAVPLPENVELGAAACLGIPALTAYHSVAVDDGVAAKSVLVTGGAGAVGHYAIQMARLMGAKRILATVSSEPKAAIARSAGADLVLNYKSADYPQRLLDAVGPEGLDRIIDVDMASNLGANLPALTHGGEIVAYGSSTPEIAVPFFPAILRNIHVRFFIVYNLDQAERQSAIAHLTTLLEQGRLQHNIACRLPLSDIVKAHELIEKGKQIGNVILAPG